MPYWMIWLIAAALCAIGTGVAWDLHLEGTTTALGFLTGAFVLFFFIAFMVEYD